MKKQFLLVLAATIILSVSAFAQGMSVGVAAGGAIPVGTFGDVVNFGFGGMATGSYIVDPNITLIAKVGYFSFGGKEIKTLISMNYAGVDISGEVTDKTDWGIIPILVGGRYYFMPEGDTRFYGGADLGLYLLSAKWTEKGSITGTYLGQSFTEPVDDSNTKTATKFGFSPNVGVQMKAGENMNVDIFANYSMIFTEGETTSFIGFGVGLEFGLGQ